MRNISFIFVLALFSINLSAQVVKQLPTDIITLNDSLKLERVAGEWVNSARETCYYKNKEKIYCLQDAETKKKVYAILNYLFKYEEQRAFYFSFYEGGVFDFKNIYFYLESDNVFITLDNQRLDGVDSLIRYKFGSVEKFREFKSKIPDRK